LTSCLVQKPIFPLTSITEILPENYTAARKDRIDGYRGVIIIHKKDLLVEAIQHEKGELVSIKVETIEKPIILTACYRSPSNSILTACYRSPSNSTHTNNKLIEGLRQTYVKYKTLLCGLVGGFNLPDIDWSTKDITEWLNEDLLDMFDSTNLTQVVHFPTRKKSTLDLFLTNRLGLIKNCEPTPGFGDHDTTIVADILCHTQKVKSIQRKVYIWKRANLASLKKRCKRMSELTATESTTTSINSLWMRFKGHSP